MGAQQVKPGKQGTSAFGPKELYNLKQVYFYMCLHTTTLTSCPLDRTQFLSLIGTHKQYKPLWRALFTAIDLNGDGIVDFEEFLLFLTSLKRGDVEARRQLCFRLFDTNRDGFVEKSDIWVFSEAKAASLRRPSWQQTSTAEVPEDDYLAFFTACDEDADSRINLEDLETYCLMQGETMVNQTLKLVELVFDGVIEETGIVITGSDVKNTKPHIDWRDSQIGMGSVFCCSTHAPVFTMPPRPA
mmetsp:Transcript_61000/g.132275  ORF Transcript_61000/g.132275 Transcript_61000/m.132275 type:complete len:243 (+) Transcript_61000:186-914(+)